MRTDSSTGAEGESLVPDSRVDRLDRQIVNALQIEPRASWSKVGAVLGVDAVTAARRWNRLRAAGLAWVTAHASGAGAARLAIVEVECAGHPLEVAGTLVHDPECLTLDITSGGRDLLIGVGVADEAALADYVLRRLGAGPQVRAVRTQIVASFVKESVDWRLGELGPEQLGRFTAQGARGDPPGSRAPTEPGPAALTELDREVLAVLGEDGRTPATEIAARTGVPVRRVRDVVHRLLTRHRVVLWTDVSRAMTGRSVQAWYFIRVSARRLAGVAAQLARLEEARLVVSTIGTYNLVVCVWMRDLTEVTRLEAQIEDGLDGVRIVDRCVTLRTVKRAGNLLDARGRTAGPAAGAERDAW
ncbi:Lrp/AsnC family transcriptional regulator [Streptomyces sp. NPDC058284]|uniref:Lrp/AsnC family transcriptional regulator n=1 Tax=unclassified Streptomyces TaxID=2593676 RepID=UPI00365DC139